MGGPVGILTGTEAKQSGAEEGAGDATETSRRLLDGRTGWIEVLAGCSPEAGKAGGSAEASARHTDG